MCRSFISIIVPTVILFVMTIVLGVSILYKYHSSLIKLPQRISYVYPCRSFISIIVPLKDHGFKFDHNKWCRSFISIIVPEYIAENSVGYNWCRSFISIIVPETPAPAPSQPSNGTCRSFISIIVPLKKIMIAMAITLCRSFISIIVPWVLL